MIRSGDVVVVALGGNALCPPGRTPTIAGQFRAAGRAMAALVPLLRLGCRIVLTHGNGPQVGNVLIRVEEALGKAYPIPLEVAVAETQGELGYVLEQSLQNVLARHDQRRPVVSLLTQVLVDPRDPAFRRPEKPVGPWLDRRHARTLRRKGEAVAELAPGRFRKVVASPEPLAIDEPDVVRWLLRKGAVVIAAGGGGVPVARRRDGTLRGVHAVVDKDLASAVLGLSIGARFLLVLTDVPCAYLGFATRRRRRVPALDPADADRLLAAGEFPPGSMGPKVEAAARFVRGGGRAALITSPRALQRALAGAAGTWITRQGREFVARAAR